MHALGYAQLSRTLVYQLPSGGSSGVILLFAPSSIVILAVPSLFELFCQCRLVVSIVISIHFFVRLTICSFILLSLLIGADVPAFLVETNTTKSLCNPLLYLVITLFHWFCPVVLLFVDWEYHPEDTYHPSEFWHVIV